MKKLIVKAKHIEKSSPLNPNVEIFLKWNDFNHI